MGGWGGVDDTHDMVAQVSPPSVLDVVNRYGSIPGLPTQLFRALYITLPPASSANWHSSGPLLAKGAGEPRGSLALTWPGRVQRIIVTIGHGS